MDDARLLPLLRIPPFPGSKVAAFSIARTDPNEGMDADAVIAKLRALRVGGEYWGLQPKLPKPGYALVRVRDPRLRRSAIDSLDREALVWMERGRAAAAVSGACDPWHLLGGASLVVADSDDELALLAAIAGIPLHCIGEGKFADLDGLTADRFALRKHVRDHLLAVSYADPFGAGSIHAAEAIDLCGFWRNLIDSNRGITAAAGFAAWKRRTAEPLLWPGSAGVRFIASAAGLNSDDTIAVWRSRTSPSLLRDLDRSSASLVEVEDGFIRSSGLGADCVPPLSIVVDRLGAHFDPKRPSELEQMLQAGGFSDALLDRARRLRETIVDSRVSKYSAGGSPLSRRDSHRTHILVPGQVEDDRAVVEGGAGLTTNLELLRRVRVNSPEAYILYKPHPDVEAGHRAGALADRRCLEFADEVVRNEPIASLLDLADEVHVISSLAGFEALLRGKRVTTYGVPFYAGWGVSTDLGAVPDRRTRRLSLDELVAAVLLLYPRYLDPETGLPCPPEILVRRLSANGGRRNEGLLVGLRRLQGRCRLGVMTLAGRR